MSLSEVSKGQGYVGYVDVGSFFELCGCRKRNQESYVCSGTYVDFG